MKISNSLATLLLLCSTSFLNAMHPRNEERGNLVQQDLYNTSRKRLRPDSAQIVREIARSIDRINALPRDHYLVQEQFARGGLGEAVLAKDWHTAAYAFQDLLALEDPAHYLLLLHGVPRWRLDMPYTGGNTILPYLLSIEMDARKRSLIQAAIDAERVIASAHGKVPDKLHADLIKLSDELFNKRQRMLNQWACEFDYRTFKDTSDLC